MKTPKANTAEHIWIGSFTCWSLCFIWKWARPIRSRSASWGPHTEHSWSPVISAGLGFTKKTINFYRDKWIKNGKHTSKATLSYLKNVTVFKTLMLIILCFFKQKCYFSDVYMCFATAKLGFHRDDQALVTGFKQGWGLSFRYVCWDVRWQTPSSPSSSQRTQQEKPPALHLLPSFFPFSSFHWVHDRVES